MNLLEVIHQRWSAATALNALLPASDLHTGMRVASAMPYAVVTKSSQRPDVYLSDGSVIDNVGLRIEVFDESHDAASAIVDQINAAFDRTAFDLSGNDRVVNMRRSNETNRQEDDGTWRMVIELECTVHHGNSS